MTSSLTDGCNDCGGCGGCGSKSPALPPARTSASPPLPLRQITGDEACFHKAHLLVSACCGPFVCPDYHQRFLRKRVTLIACPNEIGVDCAAVLSTLLTRRSILTVTVVRMEASCCDGLETALREALRTCDKFIPWRVVTLDTDGRQIGA